MLQTAFLFFGSSSLAGFWKGLQYVFLLDVAAFQASDPVLMSRDEMMRCVDFRKVNCMAGNAKFSFTLGATSELWGLGTN